MRLPALRACSSSSRRPIARSGRSIGNTREMSDSLDAEWLGVEAVNEVLGLGLRWTHGPVTSIDAHVVGADFGFSGRVYRLHLGLDSDGPASIVAKFENAEAIARAVAFRNANELLLVGQVPTSLGARIDHASDRGLILLEDVSPATQGNDVTGCSEAQAGTIIRLVAMLHAHTWMTSHDRPNDSIAAWSERDWETDRWTDRLTRAAARFPGGFDTELSARLSAFPAEAADAYDTLQRGPRAWVHRDPHPDNALWRADGRLVMLDWSNAMIAPPAIDVAVLLSSLAFREAAPLSPEEVLTEYIAELGDHALRVDDDDIRHSADAAVRLIIRGSIGWAGSTSDRSVPARLLELQAQVAQRVRSALRWLDD